jgi:histidinol-phosphatase
MRRLDEYLEFAMGTAWEAGRSTLAHYQANAAIDRKADGSVVTVADRHAEQVMRARIRARFPDHSVVGEEFGVDERDQSHRWFLDPIDGTNTFVRGVPFFGALMALCIDDEPVVGVCYLPALDEMIAAARGLACRWNGRLTRVSSVSRLSEACVVYTDTRHVGERIGDRWPRLQGDVAIQRGWGDCYGHCLIATGRADVMIDPRMHPWDCAAFIPIMQEAGGRFTDWRGRVTIDGGDAVSTNGVLHEEVLDRIGLRTA